MKIIYYNDNKKFIDEIIMKYNYVLLNKNVLKIFEMVSMNSELQI
ncbi:MAG: hypothetical protein ACOC1K_01930 [Nanoarchaeota archaeon]